MKSRKIISYILCFALLLSFAVPVSAQAEDNVISEGAFDYRITAAGAEVIRFYTSGSSVVEVPSQVQGYSVVAIGADVFRNIDRINRIILPEGIRDIGDRAFYACADLESITLPNSLKTIGQMSFCNCYALDSLQIPANVQTIGMSAFLNCTTLQTLQVAAENPYFKAVDNVLFSADMTVLISYLNSKNDTSYTVPEQVCRIGEKAFLECGYLQQITLPEGLNEVEKYAFSGCAGLTAVTIPDSVEKIGAFAFNNCSGLNTVVLGNGITEVPAYAFSGCSSLENITLPDSLQTIGSKAFAGPMRLESICISDSVREIAEDAFANSEVGLVRFYSTVQKDAFAELFPNSQIVCLCKGEHNFPAEDPYRCSVCGLLEIPGDMDGNRKVDVDDVVQLLLHVSMPDMFSVKGNGDVDGNKNIDVDDVVLLLLHVSMPDIFPI